MIVNTANFQRSFWLCKLYRRRDTDIYRLGTYRYYLETGWILFQGVKSFMTEKHSAFQWMDFPTPAKQTPLCEETSGRTIFWLHSDSGESTPVATWKSCQISGNTTGTSEETLTRQHFAKQSSTRRDTADRPSLSLQGWRLRPWKIRNHYILWKRYL